MNKTCLLPRFGKAVNPKGGVRISVGRVTPPRQRTPGLPFLDCPYRAKFSKGRVPRALPSATIGFAFQAGFARMVVAAIGQPGQNESVSIRPVLHW